MRMRCQTAARHRRVSWVPPLQPAEPWAALLERIGGIENEEHIILLGPDGPDLMCILLRTGAPNVTHLRSCERLEAGSASMIVVPPTGAVDWLEKALPAVRHALIPNGRLVVAVDPVPSLEDRVGRWLKLQAFAAVRIVRVAGLWVLTAEVPAYGFRLTA